MPEYQTLADNETVALQEAGTVAMTFQVHGRRRN